MGAGCSKKDSVQSAGDSKPKLKPAKRKSSTTKKPVEAFESTTAPATNEPTTEPTNAPAAIEKKPSTKSSTKSSDEATKASETKIETLSSSALESTTQQTLSRSESSTKVAAQSASQSQLAQSDSNAILELQKQPTKTEPKTVEAIPNAIPSPVSANDPTKTAAKEKEKEKEKIQPSLKVDTSANANIIAEPSKEPIPLNENETLVKQFDPLSPAKPPLNIPEHAEVELIKCILCERSFAADRIEKHKKVCTGNETVRAVFDVAKKRNEDTSSELVLYVKHDDHEEKQVKLEKASVADLVTQIKEVFPQTSEEVYLYLRLPTRQTPITNDNQLFYGAKIVSSNSVLLQTATFAQKKVAPISEGNARPSALAPLPPVGRPGRSAPLNLDAPDVSGKSKPPTGSAAPKKKRTPEASERIRQAKAEAARQRKAQAKASGEVAKAAGGEEDKWNMEVMMPTGNASRRPGTASGVRELDE